MEILRCSYSHLRPPAAMDDLPVFSSGLPSLEQDFSWLLSMPTPQPPPPATTAISPLLGSSLSPPTEPPTKRQKSCQACRLRRVKCERPAGSNDCTACIARGFRCVRRRGNARLRSLTRHPLQLPTHACTSSKESCCYTGWQEDRTSEVRSSYSFQSASPLPFARL